MTRKRAVAVGLAGLLTVTLTGLLSLGQGMGEAELTDRELEKPDAACRAFLEALHRNPTDGVDAAYEQLLTGSPLADAASAAKKKLDRAKLDTQQLLKQHRATRAEGYAERVKAQRIGRDLAVIRYLYKFDRLPVVWHFTFYRHAAEGWVLLTVRFDYEYELLTL